MTSPLASRVALRFALLLASGIGLGSVLAIGPSAAFWALLVLFSSALVALALRRRLAAGLLLALSVVLLGTYLLERRVSLWEARLLVPLSETESVSVTGLVLEDPVWSDATGRFVVQADSVCLRGTDAAPAKIMVRLRQADSLRGELRGGSVVTVAGLLDPVPDRRNPGERNPRPFFCLNDITGVMTADGGDVTQVHARAAGPSAFVASVRRSLGEVLDRHHAGETRSYLKGIVLALRSEMSDEQREAFLVSGTFHVIAVSGLHVGLIVLILHALLGLLRLRRRPLLVATMAGLVAYMVVTGSTPSVVRATIMACVLLGGPLVERPVDVFQSLGVAGSIALVADPMQLFDPGFQLSFAAVFAIAALVPLWSARKGPRTTLWGKLTRAAIMLVRVSLAAQLGTLPLAILLFERISLVSLLANLVIVPLSSLNVALGIATVAFDPIAGALAAPYAALNEAVARIVLRSAELASQVPGASVPTVGWSVPAAFGVSVVLASVMVARRPAALKACLLLLLVLANWRLWEGIVSPQSGRLTITVLDVGQGDAIVIESPDAKAVLIDGGPAHPSFDTGERVVVPFLKRRGIERLEAVILTHAHSDHIGGLRTVLEQLDVERLLVATDSFVTETARALFETARRRGTAIEIAGQGTVLSCGAAVRLYGLHPRQGRAGGRTLNNMSIVCKLVCGERSVLFAGDIETDVEAELVRRYGAFLASDVLKVAHHGAATSSSDAFLDRVGAREALISVGWRNRFSHPSPGVLRQLSRRGMRTRRTDRSGALTVSSDGRGFTCTAWRL